MQRRSFLTLTGIGLLTPAALAACSAKKGASSSSGAPSAGAAASATPHRVTETLRVHVPTTLAYMAPMTSFGTHGKLDEWVGSADVQNWEGVDVLKSLIAQGQTDLAATPSYAAANLFNKGVGIRLVAVQVWGMLYVLGPEGSSAQGLEALRGQTVAVPLPNNMPDLVFRYLLAQKGWDAQADLTIQSFPTGQEALNALLTGQVSYAVLPEHAASVALAKGKQAGLALERTVNLQSAWAEVTGGKARFPMAGLVMPQSLTDSEPGLVGAILDELDAAVAATNAAEEATIKAISERTEVPAPIVSEVIPRLQLEVVPAAEAKEELEDFFTRLATISPDVVGGSLPADDFYLADPRASHGATPSASAA